MDELSCLFRKRARWTWRRLQEAYWVSDLGYSPIGEQSLTNLNLLYLRTHAPVGLQIELFTTRKEWGTGADWEWWFIGATGSALGLRVQAKVINDSRNAYDALHYRRKRRYQVETLIADAAIGPYPKLPIYCLYSHWIGERRNAAPSWSSNLKPKDYGCALLDAHYVQTTRGKKATRTLSHLFPKLLPWHCLFCNPANATMDLPERVLAGYIDAFRTENSAPIPAGVLRSEMPWDLHRLLQIRERDRAVEVMESSSADPKSISADLVSLRQLDMTSFVGLSGLVVFREDERYKRNQHFLLPAEPPQKPSVRPPGTGPAW